MRKWIALFTALFVCLTQTTYAAGEKSMNANKQTVVLETTLGTIEVVLMPDVAPKTCENFTRLITEKKYYDGVPFHRVIKNFMIQGGDAENRNGTGGQSIWGKNFEDECKKGVSFTRPGLLAMANRGPNTNGSQFFITTAATPWLDMKHTIFGEITEESKAVLKKIETTKTNLQDKPIEDVKIIRAYLK